jgi:transcriptional regulator with XRE-family HTH domain
MSPKAPSKDPRIIRAALLFAETSTMNATARKFSVQHHTIKRWIAYRAERNEAWPTDQDIADWDAKAPQRAKSGEWKRRYIHRLHGNGGQPLMRPPHGTVRRLQALCAIGWTQGELGERLGITSSRVSNIIRLTRTGVWIHTAEAVAALYDELSMTVPTGRDSNYARTYAASKGWAPPLAWDDEAIDDPDARPVGVIGSIAKAAGVDESAIERRILGDRTARLHKGESAEVVRRLLADGWTQNAIRRHTGLKPDRYIDRTERQEIAA